MLFVDFIPIDLVCIETVLKCVFVYEHTQRFLRNDNLQTRLYTCLYLVFGFKNPGRSETGLDLPWV